MLNFHNHVSKLSIPTVNEREWKMNEPVGVAHTHTQAHWQWCLSALSSFKWTVDRPTVQSVVQMKYAVLRHRWGKSNSDLRRRAAAFSHFNRRASWPVDWGRLWGETVCKCPRVAFIAIGSSDLGDSWALKQSLRKAFPHAPARDIKTILYSIIFYMAVQAPLGAIAV